MAKQQNWTVSTDSKENLRWGNYMKLKQTIGIALISIILLSVTAISALANDDTNNDTNSDTAMYDTATYDTTTLKSIPEVAAPNLIAAFTATHDPNRPLTIRFTDTSIGEPVPYRWGTKYGLMTYFWGFGDKSTSILRNPVHPFKEPGRYKVYLRIQNTEGQVSKAVMYIDVQR
jgi:PKD repeat protein